MRDDSEVACAPGSVAKVVRVASIGALQNAIDRACPGDQILIQPGHYVGKVRVRPHVHGDAERPIRISSAEGLGSVIIDGGGTSITWKFIGSSFVEVRGLRITGGGYHGVFFEAGANNIVVEGNQVFDNHEVEPLDSHAEIKGSGGEGALRPRKITIKGNDIFHTRHPPGGNFQGIDCNLCSDFAILGNHIHDINSPTSYPYSYYDRGSCIQMKSASEHTLIEGNLIERCHIGIVLGGEGLTSPENISGVVRNNIIIDAYDIGIAIVNAEDAVVVHNTILGSARDIYLGVDRRYEVSRNAGLVANNVISNPISGPQDEGLRISGNQVLSDSTAEDLFRDPANGDFRLAVEGSRLHTLLVEPGLCPPNDYLGQSRTCGMDVTSGAVVP